MWVPLPGQRVLAFLAVNDRPVVRAALAERLWSDGTGTHALGSLRSALWRLRRSGVALVGATNGRLELLPNVSVDTRELLSWSRRQLDGYGAAHDAADLEQIRTWGELLPDWYDDWVILERERLREIRARALEALCDRLTAAGRYGWAGEAARAAICDDPLRESAHRCLIRLHLAEGNTAEAIRCYRWFRDLLFERLGVEPSNQMNALVATVMTQ
jgi:DNA-binding SARP family transcriptional activator